MVFDKTQVSLGRVLVSAPSTIPDDAKNLIEAQMGSLSALEVGRMSFLELLEAIRLALPHGRYDNDACNAAAKALRAILLESGFRVELAELTLPQLLQLLTEQPDRHQEVVRALNARDAVLLAGERSDGQWIVLDPDGGIDISATVRYVRRLSGPWYWLWRWFNRGSRVALLEEFIRQAGANPVAGARSEEACKKLVLAAARKAGVLRIEGNNGRRSSGVYRCIKITGSNNKITGVTVLERVEVQGNNNKLGVTTVGAISSVDTGANNEIVERPTTWAELADRLQL